MKNKIYLVGITAFLLVWFGLTGAAWFGNSADYSKEQRRPLAQAPKLDWDTIVAKDVMKEDGTVETAKSFKTLFQDYTLDQFPLRQPLRRLKSAFSTYVMGQRDESGLYVQNGYAAEHLYPLNETALKRNVKVMQDLSGNDVFKNNNIYTAVIPDKGYFIGDAHGYPNVDYQHIFQSVQEGVPNATYIDLTKVLQLEDYYYSDTHWTQDRIVLVAQALGEAMGVTVDDESAYTKEKIDQPYYGVYYGASLPMKADTMYLMHSEVLDGCTVRLFSEKGATPMQHKWEEFAFYDMSKTELKEGNEDLYNIFFSNNQTMIQITNPKGPKGKELIVFGDSYARSLVPLLVSGYSKVTLIDMRIKLIHPFLDQYLRAFPKRDVLFIYGAVTLNGSIVAS